MIPLPLLLLFPCLVFAKKDSSVYSTSYVFVTAANTKTGDERKFCANYLQYKTKALPSTSGDAKPLRLEWWGGLERNINVCNNSRSVDLSGAACALKYRIDMGDGPCAEPFTSSDLAFRNASTYEVRQLHKEHADAAILLLEKGRQFVRQWRDFLFSDFTDPYLEDVLPTFFTYTSTFYDDLIMDLGEGSASDVSLRFWRPPDPPFDVSMLVIWALAVFSVAGGGLWAFVRKRAEESGSREVREDPLCARPSDDASWLSRYANYFLIALIMTVLVGILMLGYFFREVLVLLFNILLAAVGSRSVYACVSSFVSLFVSLDAGGRLPSLSHLCRCCETNSSFLTRRYSVLRAFLAILSISLCVYWFLTRKQPYAFLLLDFINVTLSLHVLKSLQLPSLKWIVVLMLCMFVYDLFMVFITPLITTSGCSVMLEVATGLDCTHSTVGYPTPPIDANIPEKFPMLMQFMHYETMMECLDLEIERGFHNVILGLGDIIIPGYLVSFCFTLHSFDNRTRLLYGVTSVIGYGVGLVVTFLALSLMKIAQPALIYLVPCTVVPITLLALCRGELGILWHGPSITAEKPMEADPMEVGVTNEAEDSPTHPA